MSKHKAMATLTEKVQSVFVARATTAVCHALLAAFVLFASQPYHCSLLITHYSL
jgi:hypothetical protein